MLRILFVLVSGALCANASSAFAQQVLACGSLQNAYGPFDYTNAEHRRVRLPMVEKAHFDAGVESLRGHASGGGHSVANDLDYTLRAFPNHHRALYAMARYSLNLEQTERRKMRYSSDCYFERATRFAPHDGTVRLVHGIYFYKRGKTNDALDRFNEALRLSPNSSEIHYNIGLVYVKLDKLDEARQHAERAYELGYPMDGLRNMLKRRGAW